MSQRSANERVIACCCLTLVILSLVVGTEGASFNKYPPDYGSRVENGIVKDYDSDDELGQFYKHIAERNLAESSVERDGDATETSSCDSVRAVPAQLRNANNMRPNGLNSFYSKYTEAYGIPVVASSSVPNAAISRACYVLRFLLADRDDLRRAYYKSFGRVAVIGRNEELRDIPEYSSIQNIPGGSSRGLPATVEAPVSTASEENLLCYADDRREVDDVLLKTLAVGVLNLAVVKVNPEMRQELEKTYRHAVNSGWWRNTNAAKDPENYFGEGTQSFFDANAYAYPADGYHNDINTRTKLRTYDTSLYVYVQNIFTCANSYIKRCNSRGNEAHQQLHMNCQQSGWNF